MKNIILLFTFLFAGATASAFIFGGQDAQKSDVVGNGLASSVVGLITSFQGPEPGFNSSEKCTGTLIARDVVLTAGHCVTSATGGKMEDLRIFFGPLQINTIQNIFHRGATRRNMIVHPSYRADLKDHKDDIALVLLKHNAPEEIPVMPLSSALPDLQRLPKFVFGYGFSDDRPLAKDDGAGVLRWMTMDQNPHVVSPIENQFLSNSSNYTGMIEINATTKGTCHGDSGGPLFVKDSDSGSISQIGITDSVIPDMEGQELYDYNNMGLIDFQKKYPNAHLCRGQQFFVNIADQYAWIQSMINFLHQGR